MLHVKLSRHFSGASVKLVGDPKPSLAGLSVGWFQNDGNVMKCLLSLLLVTKVWILWSIVPFLLGAKIVTDYSKEYFMKLFALSSHCKQYYHRFGNQPVQTTILSKDGGTVLHIFFWKIGRQLAIESGVGDCKSWPSFIPSAADCQPRQGANPTPLLFCWQSFITTSDHKTHYKTHFHRLKKEYSIPKKWILSGP